MYTCLQQDLLEVFNEFNNVRIDDSEYENIIYAKKAAIRKQLSASC